MKRIKIKLEELTCPSCITKIESVLSRTAGIEEVRVFFNSSQVKITFRDDVLSEEQIIDVIEKLGYPVMKGKTSA